MGLLNMGAPDTMTQPQGAQGLLGGGSAPQAPQSGRGIQLATQLAQNPTQQMAQQIIAQLRQSGSPEADQLDQILQKTGGDPVKIKQIAEFVIQHLSAPGAQ